MSGDGEYRLEKRTLAQRISRWYGTVVFFSYTSKPRLGPSLFNFNQMHDNPPFSPLKMSGCLLFDLAISIAEQFLNGLLSPPSLFSPSLLSLDVNKNALRCHFLWKPKAFDVTHFSLCGGHVTTTFSLTAFHPSSFVALFVFAFGLVCVCGGGLSFYNRYSQGCKGIFVLMWQGGGKCRPHITLITFVIPMKNI